MLKILRERRLYEGEWVRKLDRAERNRKNETGIHVEAETVEF
jgi:hypothetical protein